MVAVSSLDSILNIRNDIFDYVVMTCHAKYLAGAEIWVLQYYIDPSLNHYRCFKCYVPTKGAVLDTDTIQMIPHHIPIPTYNDATAVRQAISDIVHIVKNSEENNIPKFWRGDKIQRAFEELADAIQQKDIIATPPVSLPIAPKPNAPSNPVPQSAPVRPVTPPTQIPFPTSIPPSPLHLPKTLPRVSLIPPMSTNLPASLPRVAPLPRVFPTPPVIRPTPWYSSAVNEWKPSLVLNHIFDASGRKQTIDNLIAGPMNKTWLKSTANELGRLAKGIPGRVRGTDFVVFISKDKVPRNKKSHLC